MDSNLHSSKDNKAHDGPSRVENHDNTTQNQSTPQTDGIAFRSRHLSQTSLNMNSDLYSSKINKVDDGPSHYENHGNHTQSQSTQTDDIAFGSRHAFISSDKSLEKEENMPQIHGWPDTADRLRKRTAWTYLALVWAVIVTLMPAIFLRESRSESQALILMGLAWSTNQYERY